MSTLADSLWIGTTLYAPIALAPANWERAVGYRGQARYLGLYWTPSGDEACWYDGREGIAGGNWPVYLQVVDALPLDEEEHISLGCSEVSATYWLVLDRETRALYRVPAQVAESFLDEQHPRSPEEIEIQQALEAGEITAQELMTMWREFFRQAQESMRQETLARLQAEGDATWACHPPCLECRATGWIFADGAYAPCEHCDGEGYLHIRPRVLIRGAFRVWHTAPQRASGPGNEVDFGLDWRLDKRAAWRVSWIISTGELYATELLPGSDQFILLGKYPSREQVDEAMRGWAESDKDLEKLVERLGEVTA